MTGEGEYEFDRVQGVEGVYMANIHEHVGYAGVLTKELWRLRKLGRNWDRKGFCDIFGRTFLQDQII